MRVYYDKKSSMHVMLTLGVLLGITCIAILAVSTSKLVRGVDSETFFWAVFAFMGLGGFIVVWYMLTYAWSCTHVWLDFTDTEIGYHSGKLECSYSYDDLARVEEIRDNHSYGLWGYTFCFVDGLEIEIAKDDYIAEHFRDIIVKDD